MGTRMGATVEIRRCLRCRPPLPTEKLRDAVDLIVVPAVGKGEQLIEKLAQPGRVPGKDDSSRLEIRQLSLGARQLVALRLNADGSRHTPPSPLWRSS